jgi:hypothetical protein
VTEPFPTWCWFLRTVVPVTTRPATPVRIDTPWGRATLVERVTVQQRAGEKRFMSLVELLTTEAGEQLVRIAYTTGGVVRRGPVTLRTRDLERLRDAVAKAPALATALGVGGDA